MHHDDEERPTDDELVGGPDTDRGLLFGGGVALGAALLAIVWIAVSVMSGGSDPSPGGATAEIGRPLTGVGATPQPSGQERCQEAANSLRAPLQAAQPAMDQWAIHIGAMNKLVVGAITLKQATAFWDQTRVGAQHRIADFRKAMRTMRSNGVDCPSPGLLAQTAEPALQACVRLVAADMEALRAARTAITTWDMHVADMERLRAGTLSPARASAMWVAMWQRGQRELRDYRSALRAARRSGSCSGAPAAVPSTEPSSGPASGPASGTTPTAGTSPSMDMPGMG